MFFQTEQSLDRKIAELERSIEQQERESAALYAELDLTPKQLEDFLADKDNFHPRDWERLQAQRQELDDRLKQAVYTVEDVKGAEKVRREQQSAGGWIYCR